MGGLGGHAAINSVILFQEHQYGLRPGNDWPVLALTASFPSRSRLLLHHAIFPGILKVGNGEDKSLSFFPSLLSSALTFPEPTSVRTYSTQA
jgi:hypothetical protein